MSDVKHEIQDVSVLCTRLILSQPIAQKYTKYPLLGLMFLIIAIAIAILEREHPLLGPAISV